MGAEAMVAAAVVKGAAGLKGAQAQAKGLAGQAAMARLQGKQEALKYQEQGVSVLDNILRTTAAITARAGAGGVDPFTGSPGRLARYALAKGLQEMYTIADNQVIALRGGEMQAQQYMTQAKGLMRAAKLNFIAEVGKAAFQGSQLGKPPVFKSTMGQGSGAYLRTGAASGTRPVLDPLKMVFS